MNHDIVTRVVFLGDTGSAVRGMRTLEGSTHSLGRAFSVLRGAAIAGLGAGIGALGASVISAGKFQAAMEKVHTQAGAAQVEVEHLSKQVIALGPAVGLGPEELAKGLFHLESVGLRGAKAMDALRVASEGAQIGGANLEATALGSAWLVNIKGAGDLHKVMGTLNAAVGAGNMRMEDLVQALGTGLLPAAKNAGLSLQDTLGALAVFTDEGYQASSAAAQFSTALHFLTNPSAKATAALKAIGIQNDQLATDMRKPEGLLVALRDLAEHLKGLSDVQKTHVLGDILPGGRGRILLTLINQLDRYQQKLHQIDTTSNQFGKDWEATQKTAAFQAQRFHAALDALFVSVGSQLLPLVTSGMQELTQGITSATPAIEHFTQQAVHDFQQFQGQIDSVAKAMQDMARFAVSDLGVSLAAGGASFYLLTRGIMATREAVKELRVALLALQRSPVLLIGTLLAAGLSVGIAAFVHAKLSAKDMSSAFDDARHAADRLRSDLENYKNSKLDLAQAKNSLKELKNQIHDAIAARQTLEAKLKGKIPLDPGETRAQVKTQLRDVGTNITDLFINRARLQDQIATLEGKVASEARNAKTHLHDLKTEAFNTYTKLQGPIDKLQGRIDAIKSSAGKFGPVDPRTTALLKGLNDQLSSEKQQAAQVYAAKMGELATKTGDLANKNRDNNPTIATAAQNLARQFQAASDLTTELGTLTAAKWTTDVNVRLLFSIKGISGAAGPGVGGTPHGDGIVGADKALKSQIKTGAATLAQSQSSVLFSQLAPQGGGAGGGAGAAGLVPGVLDDLAVGRQMGLTLASGFRPGAITSTGNESLHAVGKAIDMTDGSSAGWSDARMRAFFMVEMGRGGIQELILSPYWWHPGSGLQPIDPQAGTVLHDHWNHVHVGVYRRGGMVPSSVFAGGGTVPGARVAADSVPAMLSPGEFVLTDHGQQLIDQHAPGLLDFVETSQMPHFRAGGPVAPARRTRGGKASVGEGGGSSDAGDVSRGADRREGAPVPPRESRSGKPAPALSDDASAAVDAPGDRPQSVPNVVRRTGRAVAGLGERMHDAVQHFATGGRVADLPAVARYVRRTDPARLAHGFLAVPPRNDVMIARADLPKAVRAATTTLWPAIRAVSGIGGTPSIEVGGFTSVQFTGKHGPIAPGKRTIRLGDKDALHLLGGVNSAEAELLHESAHVFQTAKVLASVPDREGGADAFAQLAGPALGSAGIEHGATPPSGYPPAWLAAALKRGRRWVLYGQFAGESAPAKKRLREGGPAGASPLSKAAPGLAKATKIPATAHFVAVMKKAWAAAAPFYGAAGEPMPPVHFRHVRLSDDGIAWTHPGKPGKRPVTVTSFVPDMLAGVPDAAWRKWYPNLKPKTARSIALNTIVHEWVHEFQKGKAWSDLSLSEGSAVAFTRLVAPKVYAKLGVPYVQADADTFNTYARDEWKATQGADWKKWILYGQFGRKAPKKFAAGGIVPMHLGEPGRDSVPAMLTPGEMVLTRAHQDALGGQGALASMFGFTGSSGPGFATGEIATHGPATAAAPKPRTTRPPKAPKQPPKTRKKHKPRGTQPEIINQVEAINDFQELIREQEADYSYLTDTYALDDTSLIVTTTTTDATGQQVDVQTVDTTAVTREAREERALIEAKQKLRALYVTLRNMYAKLIELLNAAVVRLKKAIAAQVEAANDETEKLKHLRGDLGNATRTQAKDQRELDKLQAKTKPTKADRARIKVLELQVKDDATAVSHAQTKISNAETRRRDHFQRGQTLSTLRSGYVNDIDTYVAAKFDAQNDIRRANLDVAKMEKDLGDITGTTVPPSTASSTTAPATADQSALIAELTQRLAQANLALGVQAVQIPIIGSFDKGTIYVPQTGLALVHAGERITPANVPAAAASGRDNSPVVVHISVADGMEWLSKYIDARVVSGTGRISIEQGRTADRLARERRV
jgi:TP901 family phage tail tape measure protein